MKTQESRSFATALNKAEKIINSPQVEKILDQAETKTLRHVRRFENMWDAIFTMLAMIKAWFRKDYSGIPKRTIVSMLAALIYFINPFDAIPDFFAMFGFIDDAAVFGFVLNSFKKDLDKFKEWQNMHGTFQASRQMPD